MVSFTTFISSVALLAGAVVAQAPNASFPQYIPGVIQGTDANIRNSWCVAEKSLCGQLCTGATDSNNCDYTQLTWNCTCSSNHSSPALQYYENTIVWNICSTAKGMCMQQNAGDLSAQQNCNSTFVCGTANATLAAASASSSSSSTTSMPMTSTAASKTGSASAATATSTAGAAAFVYGREIGTGAFAAGLLGVAGLFL